MLTGFELYGGATISRVVDGSGAEYIGCCARKLSNGVFGFYIFRNNVELTYAPFQTGRGTLNNDGHWVAWTDKSYDTGTIPGFVAVTAAQGPAGPAGAQGPQGIPGMAGPQGPQGPASEGVLDPADRALIDRIRAFLLPLLGP